MAFEPWRNLPSRSHMKMLWAWESGPAMTSNTRTLSALTRARMCSKFTRMEFLRTRMEGLLACGPTSNFRKSRGRRPCCTPKLGTPNLKRKNRARRACSRNYWGYTIVHNSIFLKACIPTLTFPISSNSVPTITLHYPLEGSYT